MGATLGDMAEWRWQDFCIALEESHDYTEYEDTLFEIIRSITNPKTSLASIRRAIDRVDGKQPDNIKVEYPKFFMQYPNAKNINATKGKNAIAASTAPPEVKVPAPEMATAGIRGAIRVISSKPKGTALEMLTFAKQIMDEPRGVYGYDLKVKGVIAAALIVLSKTKQGAMDELLDQLDGKVSVTYKLLGDDVYMTNYDEVAPAGGYLDADGVYTVESSNITDTWALKLGQGDGG